MAADYQTPALNHPRVSLATLPTPLERAERLEAALRAEGCVVPRIYIKRDDLLGLGLGGNKVRNLEFQIGQALHGGATDVFTEGRQQSNHCRLTAAACARTGLRAHLVLSGARPSKLSGNLLLADLFGARLYFCGSADRAVRAVWLQSFAAVMPSLGLRTFVIPVGGSDARGALGHVLLAHELASQLDGFGVAASTVVVATATGGMQAGLLAGFRSLSSQPPAVVGFAVARTAPELSAIVGDLCAMLAAALGIDPPGPDHIRIDDSVLGDGYGAATDAGVEAARLLAETEGLVADPTYTAKALAGLLGLIRSGAFRADETVVFVHSGGAPAIFADPESWPPL